MNTGIITIHFIIFVFALLLWIGAFLFLFSQFVRFNFISAAIPSLATAIIVCFIPAVRLKIIGIIAATAPVSPGVILAALFLLIFPLFFWSFEYRGFGLGRSLIRSMPVTDNQDVILTFDDGPSERWTGEISRFLASCGIAGLFFVVGSAAKAYPDKIKELSDAGMVIGVHSQNHRPLALLFTRDIEREIDLTIEAIRAAGGNPIYFRPPWGFYTREVLEIAKSRGLVTVLWSRSTQDWKGLPAEIITKNALKNLKPGEIILFHDGHKEGLTREPTLRAMSEIVEQIKSSGYNIAHPNVLERLNKTSNLL